MRKMYNNKIGDPSSEFGYSDGGERFDKKIQQKTERSEWLWGEFVSFMKDHEVVPSELREMFTRYYKEYVE